MEAHLERSKWLLLIGLTVLLLGALVYVIDRPPEQVPVLSDLNLSHHIPALFGSVGHSLPTFAHVFAFCLLTALLLGNAKRNAAAVCLAWFCVDSAFELGQTEQAAGWLQPFIPQWFDYVPILDQTGSFFGNGTFDVFDLISIALGAVTAYSVIHRTALEKNSHA